MGRRRLSCRTTQVPIVRSAALFDRIVRARSAMLALYWLAFLEGAVLPVPLEAAMAPYMQLRRDRVWLIAAVGLAGFLTSALVGYLIGALLFDQVGPQILDYMGWQEQFVWVQDRIETYGFIALVILGAIPVPTQVGMIGAGALGFPLWLFLPAVSIVRGLRYFGLAFAVLRWGDGVEKWMRRRTRRNRRAARKAAESPAIPAPQPPR